MKHWEPVGLSKGGCTQPGSPGCTLQIFHPGSLNGLSSLSGFSSTWSLLCCDPSLPYVLPPGLQFRPGVGKLQSCARENSENDPSDPHACIFLPLWGCVEPVSECNKTLLMSDNTLWHGKKKKKKKSKRDYPCTPKLIPMNPLKAKFSQACCKGQSREIQSLRWIWLLGSNKERTSS
jgi:hypothetical protein